ncbi:hypothetical protein Xsto_03430 [Xenorhabdus stockiae]|uniref:Uncharacterized protein n=1 Tax=Xenorhabdus stockiae TaxID=351614 RepID=A0A2D0KKL5_9GAMM|nr:hypothetical protein [Xenorhabdus stockiae]PHM63973.1 hypothetical protein Xsto_03430 [Xenorhabdus stockiae]
MNNDVIELAREMKKRSEAVLSAESEYTKSIDDGVGERYFREVNKLDLIISPKNIIRLCEAVEKLAEYENMKPMAIYNLADGEVYKSIHDIGDNKSVFAVSLYPHPNK